MKRLARLWPFSWLLVIPAITVLAIWSVRTVDMYRQLGLRTLGDDRLGGMTLHKAGMLQFDYLARSIRLEVRDLVADDSVPELPRIHLFVQEADLAQLDSARPRSGLVYKDARLFHEGRFARVKVRYRGDFATHWGFFKRSFRVKTRRTELFQGIRRFNLITPKTEYLYSNHAGYEMAHLIGLLAPRSEMVNLNVNGRHKGVHLLVEQVSETTLRAAGRLPGDIYSGDELHGSDTWEGIDLPLFESAGLWKKVAYDSHYPEAHNEPLRRLLQAINTGDQTAIETLVDFEAFARLNLWEQLGNARHFDDKHNWRLYFDPGRARFFPVLWDGLPWSNFWLADDWQETFEPPKQIIASRFMKLLHENEDFRRKKTAVFHDFVTSDKPARLQQIITTNNAVMRASARTDTAILTELLDWTETEASIARMEDNLILVQRIVDHLARQYGEPLDPRSEEMKPEEVMPTTIWQGEILLSENTWIDTPLEVRPGTRISLADDVSLFLRNKVTVNGTADAPVTVTASGEARFGTVAIEGPRANGSRLNWLIMSGGSGYRDELREYSGMLSIHEVSGVQLNHCRLSDNGEFDDQMHAVYSELVINDCHFVDAPMDAVDLDISRAEITDSFFGRNGNDGLDLMTSVVEVRSSVFSKNGDKGISVGEGSLLDVRGSRFADNQFAIQIKDDSLVSAVELDMVSNPTAVDAYAKNWRYGRGGYGVFCASVHGGENLVTTTDSKSRINSDAESCPMVTALAAEEILRLKSELDQ